MQVIDRIVQIAFTGGVWNGRILIAGKTPCDVWVDGRVIAAAIRKMRHMIIIGPKI